ncbi:MAG: DUF983 domain-containing protein [Pseudomonadota bacterium]|nr:DUF983 domain-containing protein [Pseudomonadota bacterium]
MKYRRGEGFPLRPMILGFRKRCPSCGKTHIFQSYLKPVSVCSSCNIKIGELRTDDIAPYFTILIVGHIVVPLLLVLEKAYHPPMWVHYTIWPALTVILTLWCLPRIKGAAIAVMWHLGLRGDETQ